MKKIRKLTAKMYADFYKWLLGAPECQDCNDILDDHTKCETCDTLMCEGQDMHDVPWGWLCVDCFDSQYG